MALLELLTGPAFLLFLAGAGIFFTVRLKGIQFFHFSQVWKETLGKAWKTKQRKAGTISPFQATATALAGTLGTGNIAGIATAIAGGGPGAVFWMWLSSLFSMALKYAEILLAVKFRTVNQSGEQVGGPMYYMEKGLGCRWMALWFAAMCVLASFGIGNMAQANAAAQSLKEAFALPAWAAGVILAAAVGLALFGGIRRIAGWTERIVPIMAVFYIGAALWVLCAHIDRIPAAMHMIWESAFHFDAASGGVLGFIVSRSVRYGVSRGVFSNEAGMGSAPIVHGAAQTDSPARQGMWGILEVFLDTTIMCTMTALVILTSGVSVSDADGAALTLSAFESVMGGGAAVFLAVSVVFFAAASIMGWSYCGEKALEYLTPSKKVRVCYRVLYLAAILLGAVGTVEAVWLVSDLLNLSMAIPNVTAVLLLSPIVVRESKEYCGPVRKFHSKNCAKNQISKKYGEKGRNSPNREDIKR